jgi:DNA-binding response OmpR family regulator
VTRHVPGIGLPVLPPTREPGWRGQRRPSVGRPSSALITLDLRLPGMDGLSVLKQLRAAARETPILILSVSEAWRERVEGIDTCADDCLPKQVHMERIFSWARTFVRRTAGRSAASQETGRSTIDSIRMAVTPGLRLSGTCRADADDVLRRRRIPGRV